MLGHFCSQFIHEYSKIYCVAHIITACLSASSNSSVDGRTISRRRRPSRRILMLLRTGRPGQKQMYRYVRFYWNRYVHMGEMLWRDLSARQQSFQEQMLLSECLVKFQGE